jgi:uncharacterized protein (TIGR04255 family)
MKALENRIRARLTTRFGSMWIPELKMALPDSPRVIYHQNPLAEVIAQVRFPPILKIDTEPPAAFQEAIRKEYPEYADASPPSPFPHNLPPQIMSLVKGFAPSRAGGIRHQFAAEDKKWQVVLTRESLELKTTTYRRWEEFRTKLATLMEVLEREYRPAAYTRVGLRYVDVIRRSILGLKDAPWSELLDPGVAGELGAPELGDVDSASRQIHSRLDDDDDNSFITMKSGIALADPDKGNPEKERCFLIDCDFHTHKRVETKNVLATLDTFNRLSGRLFRWCVRPRLRDALGPEPAAAQ